MPVTGVLFDARYLLGPLLGRGGMADVYRADDLVSGRSVAVKLLRTRKPSDVRRFRSEAEVLARLDHPALVRLLDSGVYHDIPFLVLELIDGEPLSRLLDRSALPPDRVAAMGATLAAGLAHAHEVGVTHRDVKPGNVLVDGDGRPHLADFGIARLLGSDALTTTGHVVGTASYLAPEQLEGRHIGPPADVYSLGLVLIEALAAVRPFDGAGAEAALARLQRDPDIPADTPPWLATMLSAMTARDPVRRPTATTVADAMRQRSAAPLGVETVRLPAASAPPSSRRELPIVRWLTAGVIAVALLAFVLLGLQAGGKGGLLPSSSETTTTSTAVLITAPPTTAPPPSTSTTTERPNKKRGKHGGGEGDG